MAALCAVGALAAVPASGQEAAPLGDYGGGTVGKVGTGPYSAGSMVISLNATGDGEVVIDAWMGDRCGLFEFEDRATLAPDGSFSVTGVLKERDGRSRLRTRYTIAGAIGEPNAAGTASAQTKITARNRRTRRCSTGTVRWAARWPTGAIGTPGSTPPASRLYGITSQRIGDVRAAIALRVSGDGKKLTRAIYSEYLSCAGELSYGLDSPALSVPIRADGTISDVEHIDRRLDHRTRNISIDRFKGRLGSTGASGTLSITSRYIDLPTGRVTRCRTGTVKWTASL